MKKKTVNTIRKFAKNAGYPHPESIMAENAESILRAMAENYPESLAESIEKGFNLAVKFWEWGQTPQTRHFAENYDFITDNLESILAILDIRVDYPGLYPTYELTRKGKKLTEYSALGAIRQFNNYWNHW